jgi:hypothetical protein
MGLISGPKIANGKCGKTTVAGTMDRGSTVYIQQSYTVICKSQLPSTYHF